MILQRDVRVGEVGRSKKEGVSDQRFYNDSVIKMYSKRWWIINNEMGSRCTVAVLEKVSRASVILI